MAINTAWENEVLDVTTSEFQPGEKTCTRVCCNLKLNGATCFALRDCRSRDYPRTARRAGAEGTVGFQLDIDRQGRVFRCRVTSSSGSDVLDEATCEALKRRAELYPAEDSVGQPVAGTYSSQISFNLD